MQTLFTTFFCLIFIAVCHVQHEFKVLMVNRLCFHSNINSDVTFCYFLHFTLNNSDKHQQQHTHFHITESMIFHSFTLFICSILLCFVLLFVRCDIGVTVEHCTFKMSYNSCTLRHKMNTERNEGKNADYYFIHLR